MWLFPDDFEAKILAAGSGVNLTAVEALPCYANGRTFDITGNDGFGQSAKDWFESRMAEPDIFLADLAAAITCAVTSALRNALIAHVSRSH